MAFRTLHQCTDCEQIVDDFHNHDCPNDPMKDPVKRAEHEEWEREFDKHTAVWELWAEAEGMTESPAYFSVGREYPDDTAFEGKCVLVDTADEFWGGEEGKDFKSEVLQDPTWGDVMHQFARSIETTLDFHHSFLEGLVAKDQSLGEPGVTVLRFSTGS